MSLGSKNHNVYTRILDQLRAGGFSYTETQHQPVANTTEANVVSATTPETDIKTLALKNKKGDLFVVTLRADEHLNPKAIGNRLSFISYDKISDQLGVVPGALAPFGYAPGLARLYISKKACELETYHVNPGRNDCTITMREDAFKRLLQNAGVEVFEN